MQFEIVPAVTSTPEATFFSLFLPFLNEKPARSAPSAQTFASARFASVPASTMVRAGPSTAMTRMALFR